MCRSFLKKKFGNNMNRKGDEDDEESESDRHSSPTD